jgi:hypothetical protein
MVASSPFVLDLFHYLDAILFLPLNCLVSLGFIFVLVLHFGLFILFFYIFLNYFEKDNINTRLDKKN